MIDKSDHDILMDIHGVLLGSNGQGGLCRTVAAHSKTLTKLIIAVIIIGMAVGGSTWGIISKLLGG